MKPLGNGRLCGLSIIFMLAALLAQDSLKGQVAGGTIAGTITDPSSGLIAGATVTIRNVSTAAIRTVVSNNEGLFTAPNLQPAEYEITVAAPGFETDSTRLVLTVGAEVAVSFSMKIGSSATAIQVAATNATVQLATSDLSSVVGERTVRELPLNGRSWTDLASLQPGVAPIETQIAYNLGAGRGNRGFGAQIAISGARPQQNNYRLDGLSLNDYANGGPGSVLGGNLGVDAIQEFSVLTSNYSSEYGKTSGGVVNAITRSGSNEFHGSVYEFLRNSALDARNFFDRTNSPPPFKRNQFGGSAGGPIVKDRTFIFGDYEGIRQSLGTTNVINVPSPAARLGHLAAGTVAVDPIVQKYLNFYALPNSGLIGAGDTGLYTFAGQQATNEDFFTVRVDHKVSDTNNLSGTYFFDNAPFTSPDSFDNVQVGSTTRRQAAVVEDTNVFSPRFVNSVRGGVNRDLANNNLSLSAINPLAGDLSLGSAPGRYASTITIPGLGRLLGGLGGSPTYFFRFTSLQLYDDAFLTIGKHSLKFGGAVERDRNNLEALSNPNGGFTFNSLSDFLTNKPHAFSSGFASTLTPRGLRQTIAGGYIQDDWRWRPNFTINLGLRYEASTIPTEVQGKFSTLRNLTDATPHLGDPIFLSNPTLHNFEPRVGFAWDPFSNGKTAVRGGFGVYDVLPLLYEFEILSSLSAPYFKIGSVSKLPQGAFPYGAFPLLSVKTLNQVYIDPSPHRNYVMQWNFNLQREIAKGLAATVGYVGSRGVHQPYRVDDVNIVMPTLTPQGYSWPSPAGSGTLLNPNAGEIRGVFYEANSFYHSLQSQLVKQLGQGVQFQASYTWSKSIDNNSATLAGDAFGDSISSLFWPNTKLSRGLSDFNVGQSLVLNALWQVPGKVRGPLGLAANGWELGGIYTLHSGVPFTAILGGDPLGLNSADPYDYPNVVRGPGCGSLVNPGNPANYVKTQCFSFPVPSTLRGNEGRNILVGPSASNLDFSLFKNNRIRKISETFNAQLRIEVFNILNHANFAPPNITNLNVFGPTGKPVAGAGALNSTVTSSRQAQFALKLVW